MIKVSVLGVEAVRELPERIDGAAERVMAKLAVSIEQKAFDQADTHTDTGRIIQSLLLDGSGLNYKLYHDLGIAPHALFVHWGTEGPYEIRPSKKKALRWPSGSAFSFATSVMHPGYDGDPWLVNAAKEGVDQIDTIIEETFRRL